MGWQETSPILLILALASFTTVHSQLSTTCKSALEACSSCTITVVSTTLVQINCPPGANLQAQLTDCGTLAARKTCVDGATVTTACTTTAEQGVAALVKTQLSNFDAICTSYCSENKQGLCYANWDTATYIRPEYAAAHCPTGSTIAATLRTCMTAVETYHQASCTIPTTPLPINFVTFLAQLDIYCPIAGDTQAKTICGQKLQQCGASCTFNSADFTVTCPLGASLSQKVQQCLVLEDAKVCVKVVAESLVCKVAGVPPLVTAWETALGRRDSTCTTQMCAASVATDCFTSSSTFVFDSTTHCPTSAVFTRCSYSLIQAQNQWCTAGPPVIPPAITTFLDAASSTCPVTFSFVQNTFSFAVDYVWEASFSDVTNQNTIKWKTELQIGLSMFVTTLSFKSITVTKFTQSTASTPKLVVHFTVEWHSEFDSMSVVAISTIVDQINVAIGMQKRKIVLGQGLTAVSATDCTADNCITYDITMDTTPHTGLFTTCSMYEQAGICRNNGYCMKFLGSPRADNPPFQCKCAAPFFGPYCKVYAPTSPPYIPGPPDLPFILSTFEVSFFTMVLDVIWDSTLTTTSSTAYQTYSAFIINQLTILLGSHPLFSSIDPAITFESVTVGGNTVVLCKYKVIYKTAGVTTEKMPMIISQFSSLITVYLEQRSGSLQTNSLTVNILKQGSFITVIFMANQIEFKVKWQGMCTLLDDTGLCRHGSSCKEPQDPLGFPTCQRCPPGTSGFFCENGPPPPPPSPTVVFQITTMLDRVWMIEYADPTNQVYIDLVQKLTDVTNKLIFELGVRVKELLLVENNGKVNFVVTLVWTNQRKSYTEQQIQILVTKTCNKIYMSLEYTAGFIVFDNGDRYMVIKHTSGAYLAIHLVIGQGTFDFDCVDSCSALTATNACKNGGSCTNNEGKCKCLDPWHGATCEESGPVLPPPPPTPPPQPTLPPTTCEAILQECATNATAEGLSKHEFIKTMVECLMPEARKCVGQPHTVLFKFFFHIVKRNFADECMMAVYDCNSISMDLSTGSCGDAAAVTANKKCLSDLYVDPKCPSIIDHYMIAGVLHWYKSVCTTFFTTECVQSKCETSGLATCSGVLKYMKCTLKQKSSCALIESPLVKNSNQLDSIFQALEDQLCNVITNPPPMSCLGFLWCFDRTLHNGYCANYGSSASDTETCIAATVGSVGEANCPNAVQIKSILKAVSQQIESIKGTNCHSDCKYIDIQETCTVKILKTQYMAMMDHVKKSDKKLEKCAKLNWKPAKMHHAEMPQSNSPMKPPCTAEFKYGAVCSSYMASQKCVTEMKGQCKDAPSFELLIEQSAMMKPFELLCGEVPCKVPEAIECGKKLVKHAFAVFDPEVTGLEKWQEVCREVKESIMCVDENIGKCTGGIHDKVLHSMVNGLLVHTHYMCKGSQGTTVKVLPECDMAGIIDLTTEISEVVTKALTLIKPDTDKLCPKYHEIHHKLFEKTKTCSPMVRAYLDKMFSEMWHVEKLCAGKECEYERTISCLKQYAYVLSEVYNPFAPSKQCPRVSKAKGICINACVVDYDCEGNKICCSTGCGSTCKNPIGGPHAVEPSTGSVYGAKLDFRRFLYDHFPPQYGHWSPHKQYCLLKASTIQCTYKASMKCEDNFKEKMEEKITQIAMNHKKDCDTDPCDSFPCQNGGICKPSAGATYTCTDCAKGFSGANCEIDDCHDSQEKQQECMDKYYKELRHMVKFGVRSNANICTTTTTLVTCLDAATNNCPMHISGWIKGLKEIIFSKYTTCSAGVYTDCPTTDLTQIVDCLALDKYKDGDNKGHGFVHPYCSKTAMACIKTVFDSSPAACQPYYSGWVALHDAVCMPTTGCNVAQALQCQGHFTILSNNYDHGYIGCPAGDVSTRCSQSSRKRRAVPMPEQAKVGGGNNQGQYTLPKPQEKKPPPPNPMAPPPPYSQPPKIDTDMCKTVSWTLSCAKFWTAKCNPLWSTWLTTVTTQTGSGIITACPSSCLTNPCQNGGTCKPLTSTTYECTCAQGFSGLNCDTETCFPAKAKAVLYNTYCNIMNAANPDLPFNIPSDPVCKDVIYPADTTIQSHINTCPPHRKIISMVGLETYFKHLNKTLCAEIPDFALLNCPKAELTKLKTCFAPILQCPMAEFDNKAFCQRKEMLDVIRCVESGTDKCTSYRNLTSLVLSLLCDSPQCDVTTSFRLIGALDGRFTETPHNMWMNEEYAAAPSKGGRPSKTNRSYNRLLDTLNYYHCDMPRPKPKGKSKMGPSKKGKAPGPNSSPLHPEPKTEDYYRHSMVCAKEMCHHLEKTTEGFNYMLKDCHHLVGKYVNMAVHADYAELITVCKDPCVDKMPCRNGGTCRLVGNSEIAYECKCPPGYSGTDCEYKMCDTNAAMLCIGEFFLNITSSLDKDQFCSNAEKMSSCVANHTRGCSPAEHMYVAVVQHFFEKTIAPICEDPAASLPAYDADDLQTCMGENVENLEPVREYYMKKMIGGPSHEDPMEKATIGGACIKSNIDCVKELNSTVVSDLLMLFWTALCPTTECEVKHASTCLAGFKNELYIYEYECSDDDYFCTGLEMCNETETYYGTGDETHNALTSDSHMDWSGYCMKPPRNITLCEEGDDNMDCFQLSNGKSVWSTAKDSKGRSVRKSQLKSVKSQSKKEKSKKSKKNKSKKEGSGSKSKSKKSKSKEKKPVPPGAKVPRPPPRTTDKSLVCGSYSKSLVCVTEKTAKCHDGVKEWFKAIYEKLVQTTKVELLCVDPCLPNPCKSGGACKKKGETGYTCLCPLGYSGPKCEEELCQPDKAIDECLVGKFCDKITIGFPIPSDVNQMTSACTLIDGTEACVRKYTSKCPTDRAYLFDAFMHVFFKKTFGFCGKGNPKPIPGISTCTPAVTDQLKQCLAAAGAPATCKDWLHCKDMGGKLSAVKKCLADMGNSCEWLKNNLGNLLSFACPTQSCGISEAMKCVHETEQVVKDFIDNPPSECSKGKKGPKCKDPAKKSLKIKSKKGKKKHAKSVKAKHLPSPTPVTSDICYYLTKRDECINNTMYRCQGQWKESVREIFKTHAIKVKDIGYCYDPCTPNPCLNGSVCEAKEFGFKCHCQPGTMGSLCGTPIASGVCNITVGATCITAYSAILTASSTAVCTDIMNARTCFSSNLMQCSSWTGTFSANSYSTLTYIAHKKKCIENVVVPPTTVETCVIDALQVCLMANAQSTIAIYSNGLQTIDTTAVCQIWTTTKDCLKAIISNSCPATTVNEQPVLKSYIKSFEVKIDNYCAATSSCTLAVARQCINNVRISWQSALDNGCELLTEDPPASSPCSSICSTLTTNQKCVEDSVLQCSDGSKKTITDSWARASKVTVRHCTEPCLRWLPCQNGATCINKGRLNYKCECPEGYTGLLCEIKIVGSNGNLIVFNNAIFIKWKTSFISMKIKITRPIKFKGIKIRQFYISQNGYISFNKAFKIKMFLSFPTSTKHIFYAPLLFQQDLSCGGKVSYKQYTTAKLANRDILDKISADVIANKIAGAGFKAKYALVVTWYKTKPFPCNQYGDYDGNTYQFIMVSDGSLTFTFFKYLSLDVPIAIPVTVGYTVKQHITYQLKYTGSINLALLMPSGGGVGSWVYSMTQQVAQPTVEEQCLDWIFNKNNYNLTAVLDAYHIPCPCSYNQVQKDRRFRKIKSSVIKDRRVCYQSVSGFKDTAAGWAWKSVCCFHPIAGAGYQALPIALPAYAFKLSAPKVNDFIGYDLCCVRSTAECQRLYEVRGITNCTDYVKPRRSRGFGDPHISSLDGFAFTFQGKGDYTLALSRAGASIDMAIQARFTDAMTAAGPVPGATVFSAVAAKHNSMTVALMRSTSGLQLYVDNVLKDVLTYASTFGDPITVLCLDAMDCELHIGNGANTFIVSAKMTTTGTMEVGVGADQVLQNEDLYFGLLGRFDGNKLNDFTTPQMTLVSSSSSDATIYNSFGKLWQVPQGQTLIPYTNGDTYASVNDIAFTPVFDPCGSAPTTVQSQAATLCGTSTAPADKFCRYDYCSTLNPVLAQETKTSYENSQTLAVIAANTAPTMTASTTTIQGVVGSVATVVFSASDVDGDVLTKHMIKDPVAAAGSFDAVTGVFQWTVTATPVQFSFYAKDSQATSSSMIILDIITCAAACTTNGACDFTDSTVVDPLFPTFTKAVCLCKTGWTGVDCTLDANGCDGQPCGAAGTCQDLTPAQEVAQNRAFVCTACGTGYALQGSDCVDINECLVGTATCVAVKEQCQNLPGSYQCVCAAGFEKGTAGCQDINECVMDTADCMQTCTNTAPGYTCGCNAGYTLMSDGKSCQGDIACSTTAGCAQLCAKISGQDVCSCFHGYTVSGTSCIDIDECTAGTYKCESAMYCKNTQGGYECSCPAGKKLDTDLRTCIPCVDGKWGVECVNTCSCGPNVVSCSKATGCVNCKAGWEGYNCNQDINECIASTPPQCKTSSKCTNNPGSYTCVCLPGFEDIAGTCQDIDECTRNLDQCVQNCLNTIGSYTCSCNPGYVADGMYGCLDINECQTGAHNCDSTNGACKNNDGSFTCTCNPGYTLNADGRTCDNVNECTVPSHTCTADQTCVDNQGSYVCNCKDGSEKDANGLCQDINECTLDIDGCAQLCQNLVPGFKCSCNTGFTLGTDTKSCIADGACDLVASGCNQVCALINTVPTCSCNPGYKLQADMKTCINIDECTSVVPAEMQQCQHAVCKDTPGNYDCTCLSGFKQVAGNSRACEDILECETNTDQCSNGCINTPGSYTCTCPAGFSLTNLYSCTTVNECLTNNGGCAQKCQDTTAGFACSCRPGFTLADNKLDCNEVIMQYPAGITAFGKLTFIIRIGRPIGIGLRNHATDEFKAFVTLVTARFSFAFNAPSRRQNNRPKLLNMILNRVLDGSTVLDLTGVYDAPLSPQDQAAVDKEINNIINMVIAGTTYPITSPQMVLNGGGFSGTNTCMLYNSIGACMNGGTCYMNTAGLATCQCVGSYSGEYCQNTGGTTTTAGPPSPTQGPGLSMELIIPLAVVGGLLFIGIMGIIIWACCRNSGSSSRSTSDDDLLKALGERVLEGEYATGKSNVPEFRNPPPSAYTNYWPSGPPRAQYGSYY